MRNLIKENLKKTGNNSSRSIKKLLKQRSFVVFISILLTGLGASITSISFKTGIYFINNWRLELLNHFPSVAVLPLFGAVGGAVGYSETDPLISFDEIISKAKGEQMEFEPEPLPDASQAKKRGRPKRSNDDAAKEREEDVRKVKSVLHDLRKNELTGAIEYDDPTGKTVALQSNDLDIMTTRLACEHGIFIPEPRIKQAIQYAAIKNQYCPIRRYLDHCAAHAKPHPEWNNIGSVFRTSDAFLVEKIYLCGITATPPHREIHKTALGATESVDWEYKEDTLSLVRALKS